MVLGKQSRYIEGFKTISVDDDVLLDNIRNAINMSIEGTNTGIGAGSQSIKKKEQKEKKPIMTKKMPTPTPTSGKSSEPMPTATLGLTNENEMTESNPEPTQEETKSPFANIKNRVETSNNKNLKSKMMSGKVIGGMDEEEPVNLFDEQEQEQEEGEEENKEDEEIINKKKQMRNAELNKKNNKTDESDDEEDVVEGFSGSKVLEARSIKNILLAVLIAFIGYVIAMASMKNMLPITEISPDLKRFKNLIYVGIFFMIVYLCLEVF